MSYTRPETTFLGEALKRPEVTTALDAVAKVKPWDRLIAHFAAPRLERWATKHYGPTKRATWWGWLHHKRPNYGQAAIRGDDHVEYRERADGKRFRISQPYSLSWDDLQNLVAFCQTHNLQAHIHGMSWWFPAATVAVIFEAADQNRFERMEPPSEPEP